MLPVRKKFNSLTNRFEPDEDYCFPSCSSYFPTSVPGTNVHDADIERIKAQTTIIKSKLESDAIIEVEKIHEVNDRARTLAEILINRTDVNNAEHEQREGGFFGKRTRTSIKLSK